MYLGERVRESSGLKWNDENEKTVRKQLDKIMVYIESGKFCFSDTFPKSEKKELFTGLEEKAYKKNKTSDQILFKEYVWEWFNLRIASGNIEGRTLNGYKGYIDKYLYPYYGDMPFGFFNKSVFDEFVGWSKEQKYRGKSVSNESIKKYFVTLKMICRDASIKYGWGITYNPFFGIKIPKGE
jgi:integrase